MMKVLSFHAIFVNLVEIIISEIHKNVSKTRNGRTANFNNKNPMAQKNSYFSHEYKFNHVSHFPKHLICLNPHLQHSRKIIYEHSKYYIICRTLKCYTTCKSVVMHSKLNNAGIFKNIR